MVTRKPLPSNALPDPTVLPYPATPTSAGGPSTFNRHTMRGQSAATDNAADAQEAWGSGGLDMGSKEDLPASLRPGNGQRHDHSHLTNRDIPESLRIRTPTPDHTPRSSEEMERSATESTNPYLRRQQTGQSVSNDGRESSADAWGESSSGVWRGSTERPEQPSGPPPPPPISKDTPLTENFASLAVESSNPWGKSVENKSVPDIRQEDSGNRAWTDIPEQQKPAPIVPPVLVTQPTEEEESPGWDETDGRTSSQRLVQQLPSPVADIEASQEEQKAWQDSETRRRQQEDALIRERIAQEEYLQREGGGWESDIQEQESGVLRADGSIEEIRPALPRRPSEEHPPALPPRRSQEEQQPSQSVVTTSNQIESVASPGGAARQNKETYEIKKVAWYDANATSNPRISPILVQNANGPCPLLALVNALTLSTPAELNTALVETLRTREQVSLGLLLDAVFDELMSGRRGDAAQGLPDVGDLYAFLVTLHTGMNVNPRFFPPGSITTAIDPRNSMSHLHPSEREESIPGTFEETREMRLYSTFSIPLIHGWLPPPNVPAYAALKRSANSYEDAQNLMFREEELEDKLQREGLSFEEQATLEDIATIKAFFLESATQLTPFGLATITKSTAPGSVAILFRNDHFSTLYRHPESHQLLHLVTDMGYAGHEEIVWESLVDVNGENCEFFSGDFRLVGGTHANPEHASNDSQWTTVSRHRDQSSQQSIPSQGINTTVHDDAHATPLSPTAEQEDHDLALAMQLQEEEEERHRAELARRRRESELSQQYIEQQGVVPDQAPGQAAGSRRGGPENIPVTTRRGSERQSSSSAGRVSGPTRGASELRPAIPPRRTGPPVRVDPEAGVEIPPPSYEQAATSPAYNPPPNHPAHPSASPNVGSNNTSRRTSAYAANSASFSTGQSGPVPIVQGRQRRSSTMGARAGSLINEVQNGRRTQGGNNQGQGVPVQDKEDKCVVM